MIKMVCHLLHRFKRLKAHCLLTRERSALIPRHKIYCASLLICRGAGKRGTFFSELKPDAIKENTVLRPVLCSLLEENFFGDYFKAGLLHASKTAEHIEKIINAVVFHNRNCDH